MPGRLISTRRASLRLEAKASANVNLLSSTFVLQPHTYASYHHHDHTAPNAMSMVPQAYTACLAHAVVCAAACTHLHTSLTLGTMHHALVHQHRPANIAETLSLSYYAKLMYTLKVTCTSLRPPLSILDNVAASVFQHIFRQRTFPSSALIYCR
jgi:hypothetical protein